MNNSLAHRLLLLFICGLCLTAAYSQIPSNPLGNNDPGLKWEQIQTDKVRLIFPKGLHTQANRIVNLVHHLWQYDSPSIGSAHVKAPIVLQPQTVLSNGFVTVAPFRSEFFARAPQFDGTTEWLDHLTIHEYQHIKQFNQTKQGITGIVRKVLGEWAWGGMIGMAIPRWYFEGDAVIAETAYTLSGRGRLPEFTMEYKSLLEKGIIYNYEKAAAGSIKDYVPNWYNLGYHLLTYGRKEYGPNLWKNVTEDAVKYKGIFHPFNRSVRRQTGKRTQELYQEMMAELETQFDKLESALPADTGVSVIGEEKKTVIHYSNPQFADNSHLWIQEFGYDRTRMFKKVDLSGAVSDKLRPGFLLDGALSQSSVSSGKVVWSELGWDIRRRYKRFSEIFIWEEQTREKKRLTNNNFDYSPSLSPDGSKIVAIRVHEDLTPNLIILDASSGEILSQIKNIENAHLSYSRWLDNDRIVYVQRANQKNEIVALDLKSMNPMIYGSQSQDPISHLHVNQNGIYFSKPINDVNQIFSIDIKTKEICQLTHDRIGAFQPAVSPDGQTLAYSSFTDMGYEVKLLSLEGLTCQSKKSLNHSYTSPFLHRLIAQEKANLLSEVKNDTFDIEGFNRFSGLLKPHSLLTNFTSNSAEMTILSDNIFSTLSADASVTYTDNEDAWRYSVGLTYAELFPEISLRAERVGRSAIFINYDAVSDSTIQQRRYVERWRENRIRGGMTLPFNFSSGQTTRTMSAAVRFARHSLSVDQNYDNENFTVADTFNFVRLTEGARLEALVDEPLSNISFNSIDLIWSGRITAFTAPQHLRTRLGIVGFARYRKPLTSRVGGDVLQFGGIVYLPGVSRNHSFSIDMDYQREEMLSAYRFSDNFDYARGYNRSLRVDELTKFGLNYRLPLWYPDLAAGGFAFVKRVKANIFYDHGLVGVRSFPFREGNQTMRSTGVELGFDVRFLRLLEVDLGVRYSYLIDDDFVRGSRHSFDFFLLSISQ